MERTTKKSAAKITARDIYPEAYRVLANITWLAQRYDTPEEDIVSALGKTQNTWITRKKEPWNLTIKELKNIADLWGLTPQQLMVEPRLVVEYEEII